MALLLDNLFSSVALGHLIVDVLNGQRAVLLAYLSGPLGMSNATLGLVSTIYIVSAALIQPLFGHMADRIGPRWVVAGGVLWMAVFFSLAVITPGSLALVLLVCASLGSGAFHPAGTMQATLRGRSHYAGKETTATAYFFVFGQLGLFFGPMLGGPLLDRFGPGGLLLLTAPAIPVGLNAARQLNPLAQLGKVASSASAMVGQVVTAEINKPAVRVSSYTLVTFAMVAAFQSWSQQNIVTFIPKYLSDLGQPASVYGLIAATFMGGSALGNILGGNLADSFGKRKVAALALLLATGPLYLIPNVGWSPLLFLLIPSAGALTGATHSILVVLAQRYIPGGMALASGLILGFMFTSGALGTLLTGYLADVWGFPAMFHTNAGIALLAAAMALTLQRN